MAYSQVIYEKKNRVAYITINRPEVMNAISPLTSAELYKVWCDFRDDPEVWVAILTGKGEKAFSAGNDLKYQSQHHADPNVLHSDPPGGFGGITGKFECNKPMIAAVNGLALGGGFEMALACDIIIAADHARFGLPEPTVGMIGGAGGVHRLPRQLPLKLAMDLILSAKPISAQEAWRIGLVNEVVALHDLIPAAEREASDILHCSPLAIRASKQSALSGLELSLQEAVDTIFPAYMALLESQDFIEGPLAFSEKRPPHWKGI